MVKGKANKTFKRKPNYSLRSNLNYTKAKITIQLIVAMKNNDQGSQGVGFCFFNNNLQALEDPQKITLTSYLEDVPEYQAYKDMFDYCKLNGIKVESQPGPNNGNNTINYKGMVQIQTTMLDRQDFNESLILNPFQHCSQYVKSYMKDYCYTTNLKLPGLVHLFATPSTLSQSYCPSFQLKITCYFTFKKNSNL